MNQNILSMQRPKKLQVGGTVNPRRSIYIHREGIEERLFQALLAGKPCNILSSRQTGKSSLMIHTARRLMEAGRRIVTIDLAGEFGLAEEQDANRWYLTMLRKLMRTLRPGFDLVGWWKEQDTVVPSQVFLQCLREHLFVEDTTPAVIFMDEIDATLRLPFSDDIFQILRTIYNERSQVPAFERLTFSLVGVATTDELIKDQRTTSYNIARTIAPRDFDLEDDDLAPLLESLAGEGQNAEEMLEAVFFWTSGHPFLTLTVCQRILDNNLQTPAQVNALIEKEMLSSERAERDVHFQTIEGYFGERLQNRYRAYTLYERLLRGDRIRDKPSLLHTQMKLSGLVKHRGDCLEVRNQIYRRVFDQEWIHQNRPRWRDAFRKPIYQTAAILFTLVIAFVINQKGIVETERDAARGLIRTLETTTDPKKAQSSYHQLLGSQALEEDYLLVKRLSGYEETANEKWHEFWVQRLEESVVDRIKEIFNSPASSESANLAFEQLASQRASDFAAHHLEDASLAGNLFDRDSIEETLSRQDLMTYRQLTIDEGQALAFRDLMFILEQTEDRDLALEIRNVLARGEPLDVIAKASARPLASTLGAESVYRTKQERWQADVLLRDLQNGSDALKAQYAYDVLSGRIDDEDLGRSIRGFEEEAEAAFHGFRKRQDMERINEWRLQIEATCDPERIHDLGKKIQGELVDEEKLQRAVESSAEHRRLGEEKIRRANKRCDAERLISQLEYGVDDLASAEEIEAHLIEKIKDSQEPYRDITTARVEEAVDVFEQRMELQAFDIHNEQLKHREGGSEWLAVEAYKVMSGQEPYLRGKESLFIKDREVQARSALRSYFQQRATILWKSAHDAKTQGRTDQALILAAAATLRGSTRFKSTEWISDVGSVYPLIYRTLQLDLGSEARFSTFALSADGSWGASNESPGHSAIIWDLETGTECQSLDKHHSDTVTTLDISSQGFLATGSADKTVRLWPMNSPCSQNTFFSGPLLSDIGGRLKDLAFSDDGHFLAAISGDDQLTLWAKRPSHADFARVRCPRGECPNKIPPNPTKLSIVGSSSPAALVTTPAGLISRDLQNGKRRRLPKASRIAYSNDGSRRAHLYQGQIEVQSKTGYRFKESTSYDLGQLRDAEVIDLQFVPGDRYLSIATQSSIIFWDPTDPPQEFESLVSLDLRVVLGCPLDEEGQRTGELKDCSAHLKTMRWYGPMDGHDGPTLVTLHGDASARIWRLPENLDDLGDQPLPPLSDWETWQLKLGLTVDDSGAPLALRHASAELEDLEACIRHTRNPHVVCPLQNPVEMASAETRQR